jgi:hypothetical protein
VEFDACIAIDWSGAAGNYDGIAVAICRPGHAAPRVVAARGRRWSRAEIADWLKERLSDGQRLLIGFDFAFAFPFENCGYLGGRARGVNHIFGLWSLIEARSAGEADFGCRRFVDDPDLAHLFWKTGPRPAAWVERKRLTELECAETTKTRPDTLYKLLHSKQVGKASITGMRVLNYLRVCSSDSVAIWPFETPRTSAIVEIYPTMFRKVANGSIAKLRSVVELNCALASLNSRPMRVANHRDLSDHETDAIISAAGLRSIARDPQVWVGPQLMSSRVRREGWIFGIQPRTVWIQRT